MTSEADGILTFDERAKRVPDNSDLSQRFPLNGVAVGDNLPQGSPLDGVVTCRHRDLSQGSHLDGVAVAGRMFRTWLLHVVFPNDEQISVMWNRRDPVAHVKAYIELKKGVPRARQVMQFAAVATPLLDERKLVDYNVKDGAVIQLNFAPGEAHFQIFIKGQLGKTSTLWVAPSDLIDEVKSKIAEKEMIPVKEQRLVCNGRCTVAIPLRTTACARTTRSSSYFVFVAVWRMTGRLLLKLTGCLALKIGWQR